MDNLELNVLLATIKFTIFTAIKGLFIASRLLQIIAIIDKQLNYYYYKLL